MAKYTADEAVAVYQFECDGSWVDCTKEHFEWHDGSEKRILYTHPPKPVVSDGVAVIAAERKRQVEAEGWTPEHDDEHATGELANAAVCYALGRRTVWWPWSLDWWKPSPENRVRELTKAGALIAAEIDRLQRAALGVKS